MDKLLFVFVLLPLVELALLTTLSHYTNLPTTILFILVTGIVGMWLARVQGLSTLRKIQEELAAGRMPRDSLVDGVLILVGGILLITPGVLTDLVGILLMVPFSRRLFRIVLIRWCAKHIKVQTTSPYSTPPSMNDDVIDTYATDRDANTTRPRLDPTEESPGI